jgi:hypothetical protein
MKLIFCLLSGIIFPAIIFAQVVQEQPDIFEALAEKEAGQGTVTIHQDARMNILLDKKAAANEGKKYIYISGYRVQVYMENSQKQSKAEAFEREKRIKEKFPELATYVTFTSPFWKLRVGDLRTHTDALVLMKSLKTEFPDMSGEMTIVRDDEVRDQELEK